MSGACFAEHPMITQLLQEKQAKMEKLQKCKGTTKKLKIAGLSTLGITAVGVGANIAEAVVLKDAKADAAEAKRKLEAQQKINCEQDPTKKWEDGECKEKPVANQEHDGNKSAAGDQEEGKKDTKNENADGNVALAGDEADKAFWTACSGGNYTPKYMPKDKPTEISCYAANDNAVDTIEEAKTLAGQINGCSANYAGETGNKKQFAVYCGKGKFEHRFYVNKKAANNEDKEAEARIAAFESKCVSPYKIDNESSGEDHVTCIVAGDKSKPAKQSEIEKALKAAYKKFGCDVNKDIVYGDSYAGLDCSKGNKDPSDGKYWLNWLIYYYSEKVDDTQPAKEEKQTPAQPEKTPEDKEAEARIAAFKNKCVSPYKIDNESSSEDHVICIVAGDKNKPAKQSEIDKALNDAYKKFGCDVKDDISYKDGYAAVRCSNGKKDLSNGKYWQNGLIYYYSEKVDDTQPAKEEKQIPLPFNPYNPYNKWTM